MTVRSWRGRDCKESSKLISYFETENEAGYSIQFTQFFLGQLTDREDQPNDDPDSCADAL